MGFISANFRLNQSVKLLFINSGEKQVGLECHSHDQRQISLGTEDSTIEVLFLPGSYNEKDHRKLTQT